MPRATFHNRLTGDELLQMEEVPGDLQELLDSSGLQKRNESLSFMLFVQGSTTALTQAELTTSLAQNNEMMIVFDVVFLDVKDEALAYVPADWLRKGEIPASAKDCHGYLPKTFKEVDTWICCYFDEYVLQEDDAEAQSTLEQMSDETFEKIIKNAVIMATVCGWTTVTSEDSSDSE